MSFEAEELYWYALVNRDTGKVEEYARNADEANQLTHKYKECEAKLFIRGWTQKELIALSLSNGTREYALPACVGDEPESKERPNAVRSLDVVVALPPGITVTIKNQQSGDTITRVFIPYIPEPPVGG